MPKELGTPSDPLIVKCTSLGQPSNNSAYWSLVTMDGRQICLGLSFDQIRLIASQASTAVAGWPVDKPCECS